MTLSWTPRSKEEQSAVKPPPFFGRACILGVLAPPLPVGKKPSSIAFVLEMGKLFY